MPKMLADGGTEYDDGTVATESQQAKVSSFMQCLTCQPCVRAGAAWWAVVPCRVQGALHIPCILLLPGKGQRR